VRDLGDADVHVPIALDRDGGGVSQRALRIIEKRRHTAADRLARTGRGFALRTMEVRGD